MQLHKQPDGANRRIEVTVTDITKCTNCTNGYVGEGWTDEYGSWQRVECQCCFLGMIIDKRTYTAVLNKNGTFSVK